MDSFLLLGVIVGSVPMCSVTELRDHGLFIMQLGTYKNLLEVCGDVPSTSLCLEPFV